MAFRLNYEDMLEVLSKQIEKPSQYGWEGKLESLLQLYGLVETKKNDSAKKAELVKQWRIKNNRHGDEEYIKKKREQRQERF